MRTILKQYHWLGNILANVDPLIKQTKTILQVYRQVVWAMEHTRAELHGYLAEAGWGSLDTGVTYLTTFAPEIDLQEFEDRVHGLVENELLMDFIKKAILGLKKYPEHGKLYFDIVDSQYLQRCSHNETAMLIRLNIERSTFYRRKKEALFLLGVCLFGLTAKEEYAHGVEQLTLFEAC